MILITPISCTLINYSHENIISTYIKRFEIENIDRESCSKMYKNVQFSILCYLDKQKMIKNVQKRTLII